MREPTAGSNDESGGRDRPQIVEPRILALVGAVLLFVGVFMPLISVPVLGNVTFFQNGRGDGTFVIALAVATAALALTGRTRWTLATGLLSLALLGYTWIRFRSAMAELAARMEAELAGNPFRGLAELAAGSIRLQWGWAVLLLGAVFVTAAGALAARRPPPPDA